MITICRIKTVEELAGIETIAYYWHQEQRLAEFNLPYVEENYLTEAKQHVTNEGSVVFVARDGAQLVGLMIGMLRHFHSAYVLAEQFWFVIPAYRNKNLGTMMMNEFIGFAKEINIGKILWTANTLSSGYYEGLKKLYVKLGAREVTTQFLMEV